MVYVCLCLMLFKAHLNSKQAQFLAGAELPFQAMFSLSILVKEVCTIELYFLF